MIDEQTIAAALLCAESDAPPNRDCPECGWAPLAYRTWFNGMRLARDYKCRGCGWGQSGPIYSSIIASAERVAAQPPGLQQDYDTKGWRDKV